MKNKSYWTYKGFIHTYDTLTKKFTKEFVKGKIIINKLSNIFYLISIETKNTYLSNIFMNSYNEQIVGSFVQNDTTIFYLTPDGKLRAKFYTLIGSKTKFGEFKLYKD